MVFAILLIVLILFVTAFIAFMIFLKKLDLETFRRLCLKKVHRISRRRKALVVENLDIENYEGERLYVDHVIFGKKYIYLISVFLLKGIVSGEENNNSWIYYDTYKKKDGYITNLDRVADKNIRDFSGILQISPDPIVNICVVPNECDFNITNAKKENIVIAHYSSLGRKIRKFEKKELGSLNQEQIVEQFNAIKAKNEERNK